MIDRDYTRLVGPVVRAIAANSERGALGKRLKALEAEAARLAEAGKRLTPDNAVARALLSDLDDALRANTALIDSVADDVVASGVRNAGAMVRGGALAGMTDAQLAALGVAWNVPDPEAVARLVQYTSSDAWTAALEKYQEGTGKVAQNALTRAFIEGKGPLAAARELRAAVTGLPVAYAEQMARTLQLTSLRDSAVAHRVANSHIIEYQIRIAALDDRCCASCVALHGTELPLDARIDDHHRGRCTSVTKVRGMAAPAVESGPDWFARQSEDRQRAMMGGARFEAWKAGAIQWGDMSRVYDDPVFGRMVGEASLKGMLGKAEARTFYRGGSAVSGGAAVVTLPSDMVIQRARALEDEVKQIVADREALIEANQRKWDYMESAEFKALTREEKDAFWDEMEVNSKRIGDLYAAERDASLQIVERIRNEIVYVDNPAQFTANLTAGARGREAIQEGLDGFARMVSADLVPSGSAVRVQLTTAQRPYFKGDAVHIGKAHGAQATVHEMGHWLERINPDINSKAREFLVRRTAGEVEQRMSALLPGHGYGKDEVAKPDAFIHPYVGKIYRWRSTEIVSMGMEYMYADPIGFATQDPDHFNFIHGLLRGAR